MLDLIRMIRAGENFVVNAGLVESFLTLLVARLFWYIWDSLQERGRHEKGTYSPHLVTMVIHSFPPSQSKSLGTSAPAIGPASISILLFVNIQRIPLHLPDPQVPRSLHRLFSH